jgi:hypothetical protein
MRAFLAEAGFCRTIDFQPDSMPAGVRVGVHARSGTFMSLVASKCSRCLAVATFREQDQ